LAEFEGLYGYRDGGTLVMVADGERLVAIINEAKYPLRAVATDTFTNPGGDPIPFVRDTTGRIVAFQEHGDTFARLSTAVSAEIRHWPTLSPAVAGARERGIHSASPYRPNHRTPTNRTTDLPRIRGPDPGSVRRTRKATPT
jgi:hypothetical protein